MSIFTIFDSLSVLFWSVAYILIIANEVSKQDESKISMLYNCGSLNLAWELNALEFSTWGNVIWCLLDIIIFLCNTRRIHNRKAYILFTCFCAQAFFYMFRIPSGNGMLVSAFAIDLFMALSFVLFFKRVCLRYKVIIAICRILGDLFAWLVFVKKSILIGTLGAVVLLLDVLYLSICLEESFIYQKRVRK